MRVFSGRQAWADVQAPVLVREAACTTISLPLRQDHDDSDEEHSSGAAWQQLASVAPHMHRLHGMTCGLRRPTPVRAQTRGNACR